MTLRRQIQQSYYKTLKINRKFKRESIKPLKTYNKDPKIMQECFIEQIATLKRIESSVKIFVPKVTRLGKSSLALEKNLNEKENKLNEVIIKKFTEKTIFELSKDASFTEKLRLL